MKDISEKAVTKRTASARATLFAKPETLAAMRTGSLPKGDPLPVAKIAAIQAAKNTSQIIPYCHPLGLEYVGVDFHIGEDRVTVTVNVTAFYKTGVEMEALTAAGIAALTLYDMAKGIDPGMVISDLGLVTKTGGKSDFTRSGA